MRRFRSHLTLKLFILFIIVMLILLFDSNTRIVTTEYDLYYKNLPPAFDGFRITSVSDIHACVYGRDNAPLIDRVHKSDPDIIAVTGDIIDSDDQLDIIRPLMSAFVEIAPVYYVTGNHEWDSGGIRPLLEMLPELGVTVLRNDYVKLTRGIDTIILAGTDDPNGPYDMKRPDEFVADIFEAEGAQFIVMLEHRNYNLDLYSSLGVDLVVSGHAHGGIVRLPFTDGLIGPKREWFPTYTSGVYSKGTTTMLVSRGVGNHTGYPRFLNNPHIPVAVLRLDN